MTRFVVIMSMLVGIFFVLLSFAAPTAFAGTQGAALATAVFAFAILLMVDLMEGHLKAIRKALEKVSKASEESEKAD